MQRYEKFFIYIINRKGFYLAVSFEMLKFAANLEVLMTDTNQTEEQFKSVLTECRTLFEKKLHDYGASWRILLEIKKESRVGDGIRPEFIALINYGIVGLVQLAKGFVDEVDMRPEEALALYDRYAHEALELMLKKNHDYV